MTRKYCIAWLGLMVLAILNGGFRDAVYTSYLGDLEAHQLSTIILLILITAYVRILTKMWPIGSAQQAWVIGGMWLLMTEAFEFGMARFVLDQSWEELFHAYNVLAGQLWIVIPLYVLISPYIFYRFIQDNPAPT